jgi:peroxiredoxin Q/BCP
MKVEVGSEAPDFSLVDQDGKEWSLSEHRGSPVVIYFFPKADTPGCTTQACDVRDHWGEFSELDTEVVGISPDKPAAMERFAGKYDLPHRLLGDPERKAIDAYGAWGPKKLMGREYDGVLRCSVVVGPDGKVVAVFDSIKAKDQSARSLEAVRALGG